MISTAPLFSGVLIFFWQLAVLLSLVTGLLHLPFEEVLPIHWLFLRLGPMHSLISCTVLFVALYVTIIWLIKGRSKYILTGMAKIKVGVYFFLILTGLLLVLNLAGLISLYGMIFTIVKLLHLSLAIVAVFLALVFTCFNMYKPIEYLKKKQA